MYVDGTIEPTGRHGARLAEGEASFAAYFNAFPAGQWCQSTDIRTVLLRISLRGTGSLVLWRSDAQGDATRVAARAIDGVLDELISVDLAPNVEGGWLWFDLAAGPKPLELISGEWCVEAEPRETRLATLSMTTMDKPDFALGVLSSLAKDRAALDALDEIVVVDQGSRKVAAHPDFGDVRAMLGNRLRVIDQANLGGSGGFARGMLEVLDAGRSGSIILLDDDVEIEPESIARGVAFASYTREPTIVGGHFFDLNRPLQLHAYSEAVSRDDFDWGPVGPERHDFASHSLRSSPWMHAPTHPDYNGWWFCLIPTAVIEAVGLAIPAFLKWDDAEFGLRAGSAGFQTVSLPGMAIWHVTWLDKNDSLGWQSFYHARNRLVAALVDRRGPGGLLPRKNFALDVRYLLTMDYHVVELRHLAYESVLAGPDRLHPELGSRLAEVREVMRRFPSGVPVAIGGELPPKAPQSPPLSGIRLAITAARLAVAQWATPARKVPDASEATIAYSEARWWQLARHRHVLAVSSDETAYQRHKLDPPTFRRMLRRALADWRRMQRRWAALGSEYRSALPDLAGQQTWRRTLGVPGGSSGAAQPHD
ncbi:glycosyltransferase [Pseudolysinimonas sp.]|uniref:glycosyltransferase n=1 Tax=Pseudolysinimonas sp. TaxID=2680009 RepID=UPI003F7EE411